MTTATRKYTPIWLILKNDGTVRITAAKPFHKRIIRAVIKEKYMDLEYHFMLTNSNPPRHTKLDYTIEQCAITFKLVENRVLELL